MAHGHQPEIGLLLWKGKYVEAAMLHLEVYGRDPEGECVPFASTLYAGRSHKRIRELLLKFVVEQLYGYALRLKLHAEPKKFMDRVDVISTIFVWAARQPEVDSATKENLVNVAAALIQEALANEPVLPAAPHSPLLVMLTRAEIHFMDDTDESVAKGLLDSYEARNRAETVRDPRQRERVLRKAGMLLRHHGRRRAGYAALIAALRVPHTSLAVKVKTLAALIGIER